MTFLYISQHFPVKLRYFDFHSSSECCFLLELHERYHTIWDHYWLIEVDFNQPVRSVFQRLFKLSGFHTVPRSFIAKKFIWRLCSIIVFRAACINVVLTISPLLMTHTLLQHVFKQLQDDVTSVCLQTSHDKRDEFWKKLLTWVAPFDLIQPWHSCIKLHLCRLTMWSPRLGRINKTSQPGNSKLNPKGNYKIANVMEY